MDAFPMVARCAGRQENTTFAIYQPRVKPICPGCGDPMWTAYSKCSGCVIKEKYDWLNSLVSTDDARVSTEVGTCESREDSQVPAALPATPFAFR